MLNFLEKMLDKVIKKITDTASKNQNNNNEKHGTQLPMDALIKEDKKKMDKMMDTLIEKDKPRDKKLAACNKVKMSEKIKTAGGKLKMKEKK